MMKKRITLAFSMILAAGMMTAGCSNNKADKNGQQEETRLQTEKTSIEEETAEETTTGETITEERTTEEKTTEETTKETEVSAGEHKLGSLKSFKAMTLDGAVFTEENIAEKEVTVINFWALTCSPCIAEMPDLAVFADKLPDNVQVVTVCLDGANKTEEVKDVLKKAGYTETTLVAGDGDFLEVCRKIQYTPSTIVVDQKGNIIGDAIIGRQKDLEQVYTDAVNKALETMGKAEISVE